MPGATSPEYLNVRNEVKVAPAPDISKDVANQLAKYPKEEVVDGCTAATHVAYACTDTAFIYPITPSTPMAEVYEVWSNSKRINIYGQVPVVEQLQSEAGAAGAVHGGLSVGSMCTTFTASQGLLLMIPPMYKIAGELLPCVFHVAARAIAGQALSIFGDHSDVMAVRQCGWALLSSASVQEAQDIAMIAHMATVKASVPFVHFFDGFRTSHELSKIQLLDYMTIRELMDYTAIQKARINCLNPTRPYTKGTAQGPEVYFQCVETSNPYYAECPRHVEEAMELFGRTIGRHYKLFEYYGSNEATDIIVIMGSGGPIVNEAIDYMVTSGTPGCDKVGCLIVRLYRPWKLDRFLGALPKTVKRICVLDRVKEPGALGEPLFLDVAASLKKSEDFQNLMVIGGRYGLGSRDFTPAMVMAVYVNMRKGSEFDTPGSTSQPMNGFTVGINDDLTKMSLDYSPFKSVDCVPAGTTQCLFWGMGSDGTVGANKNVIKIIGMNTPLRVQGYFAYSAHKAGGLTCSHLRFGPKNITSQYLLQHADYIGVHRESYLEKYGCLDTIKQGGKFVLNTEYTTDELLEQNLPGATKRAIAQRNVKFYVIDANKVAAENGMGRRINNVLMTSFFKVSGVLPFEEAIGLFKSAIKKTYERKGMYVVQANWKCVDAAIDATREVHYDREAWLNAPITVRQKQYLITARRTEPDAFVTNVMAALETPAGVDLPVSTFAPFAGGKVPPGTAGYEKRGVALNIPVVNMDKCTQCNQCSFVCPHAAIRPFLVDDEEAEKMPATFDARKCKAPQDVAGYKYRIQVSPMDCTGCELCYIACPDNALTMKPLPSVEKVEGDNWRFAIQLREKAEEIDAEIRKTLKGSQFYTPLMEFSGACEGCGETPYVKLLTQLFGERLVIANATGCSSIWGASYPANAYTTNSRGEGPAWGNSLFEDAAEYGYGMAIGTAHRRERLHNQVMRALEYEATNPVMSDRLHELLADWAKAWKDAEVCRRVYREAKPLLEEEHTKNTLIADIYANMDLLPKISQWIIGGDGWAYDIGYGGVDHVVASGVDVNILILDTEVYSNTGGQVSKATPLGAVHKFASGGRMRNKKDLGALCIEYGDTYVANIASSANMAHTVRAFVEAESYDGTSVIMAYSPCIEHQYIKPFALQIEHCKLAVDSGFWPLYRYDPRLLFEGKSAFQLDSKKLKAGLQELLKKENRFAILRRGKPELADELERRLQNWIQTRHEKLKLRSLGDHIPAAEETVPPEKMYNILFGTDTGNCEALSARLAKELQDRGLHAQVINMDDVCVEDIAQMINVVIICSTAGQGAFPPNAKKLWDEINSSEYADNTNVFEHVNFSVMGLGDSAYVMFNAAAKNFNTVFARLGGRRVAEIGLGDDQHEDGFEAGYQEWLAEYLQEIKAPEPLNATDGPLECAFKIEEDSAAEEKPIVHQGFKTIELVSSTRLTPEDYDVEIRHLEFDLGKTGLKYALGDSLALIPQNDPKAVEEFCAYFGFNPNQMIKISSGGKPGSSMSGKYAAMFANPVSVRQLFSECVTPFTKPSRAFYENVFRYAQDETEKAQLKLILDKSNRETLREWTLKETVSCFDVMKKFKSVKPSLQQMLDILPVIKPRYYSIASSQKALGMDRLQLCIGVVEWKTKNGEHRKGEMTSCISRWRPQKGTPIRVMGSVKPTVFTMPPTDEHPMIVAGMGTGLAPFRAFIQYRAWLKKSGKPVGPLSVYFGCRYRAKDYLYQDELEQLKADGVITELECAFSRDQKEKDYIQHHIERNGESFYKLMAEQDGYFYLCGSAKQVPIDVRNAVIGVIVKYGGKDRQQADQMVTQWQLKGKYNIEAW